MNEWPLTLKIQFSAPINPSNKEKDLVLIH
jgi:hypothetical protein